MSYLKYNSFVVKISFIMKTFRKIWKKFWQPILGLGIIQWIIVAIAAAVIWIVYFTCWRTINNRAAFRKYRRKSAIFVFWHGRSMMLSPIVRMYGIRGYAVASRSKDGRMMAKLQRIFGLCTVYGSSTDGGISALRQGVRILRNNSRTICMSPDGPSGPSLRVKDGALYFAKMSGAPIIPVCFSCSRPWFQNRWDRYLIARPFSRVVCHIGEPVFVDAKIDRVGFEKLRKKLERAMVAQVRKLDAEFTDFKVEQDQNATDFKNARRARKTK